MLNVLGELEVGSATGTGRSAVSVERVRSQPTKKNYLRQLWTLKVFNLT